MNFYYSAGVMDYGHGRTWHRRFNFPPFSRVTRTITMRKHIGTPFAILILWNSVWNRVGLHNVGFAAWAANYTDGWAKGGIHLPGFERRAARQYTYEITPSIAGSDDEIRLMVNYINKQFNYPGIELNFSCPNSKDFKNKTIPESDIPIYLKLNYLQDPYDYDIGKVKEIRVNSIPSKVLGAWSGKLAKKKNWKFIEKYNKMGLKVSGCSMTNIDDAKCLEDIGCESIGIGSIILTRPRLVELLLLY